MSKVTDTVAKMVTSFVEERGLFLWDVRLDKEGPNRILRIMIDGERAVDIDDCEAVSRAIDPLLDEADLIDEAYYLEVSSAGLGRRLTRQEHFDKMLGEEVTVALYKAVDGSKEHVGVLVGRDRDNIIINTPQEYRFENGSVRYVKLNDDLNLF